MQSAAPGAATQPVGGAGGAASPPPRSTSGTAGPALPAPPAPHASAALQRINAAPGIFLRKKTVFQFARESIKFPAGIKNKGYTWLDSTLQPAGKRVFPNWSKLAVCVFGALLFSFGNVPEIYYDRLVFFLPRVVKTLFGK